MVWLLFLLSPFRSLRRAQLGRGVIAVVAMLVAVAPIEERAYRADPCGQPSLTAFDADQAFPESPPIVEEAACQCTVIGIASVVPSATNPSFDKGTFSRSATQAGRDLRTPPPDKPPRI